MAQMNDLIGKSRVRCVQSKGTTFSDYVILPLKKGFEGQREEPAFKRTKHTEVLFKNERLETRQDLTRFLAVISKTTKKRHDYINILINTESKAIYKMFAKSDRGMEVLRHWLVCCIINDNDEDDVELTKILSLFFDLPIRKKMYEKLGLKKMFLWSLEVLVNDFHTSWINQLLERLPIFQKELPPYCLKIISSTARAKRRALNKKYLDAVAGLELLSVY